MSSVSRAKIPGAQRGVDLWCQITEVLRLI